MGENTLELNDTKTKVLMSDKVEVYRDYGVTETLSVHHNLSETKVQCWI